VILHNSSEPAGRAINILHVIINLNAGGAELMLKRLIDAQWDDRRFHHRVVSLSGKGSIGPMLEKRGVDVRSLRMRGPTDLLLLLFRLAKEIRRDRPEIIQCWMYHADLLGGLAARIAGVRRVVWGVRIADIGPEMGIPRTTTWIRLACAKLSRFIPDRIVYVAQSARLKHEALGYNSSRGLVIPNGYTLPLPVDRSNLRKTLGLQPGCFLVGSAGRFSPQKDPLTFVRGAAIAVRQHPNMRFVMIGRGYTAENAELRQWLADAGLTDHFYLLGERDDLPMLLAGLDLFCLHSIGEGFPNVVAEAMSVALPCVVTDVGDARLLVDDSGIVVPPSNPALLADAICRIAIMGEESRRAMGDRARSRIASKYSLDLASRRYARLYEELIMGDRPHKASKMLHPTGN
jgi:glycosyltransferase involved in cell wall biosynthesis